MTSPAERIARGRAMHRRWSASSGLLLLVIDPDVTERHRLVTGLQAQGIEVLWYSDGASALVAFGRSRPHAVVVAPSLAGVDAASVVRAIRAECPIPVLVPVGGDDHDAAGPLLLAGASAVSRPYEPQELLRRLEERLPNLDQEVRLAYGPLELDPRAYSVHLRGQEIKELPLKEFELLRLLMTYADQVVSTDEIIRTVWGEGSPAPSASTITVHVARLRARVGSAGSIRRIRGRGYRLTIP